MIRLLKIELQKYIAYKAFWLMLLFYTLILSFMIFGIPGLIDYIAEKSGEPSRFRIFKAIVFNFPDIWQNISYVAGARFFIKIILGIIIIILVTNEFHFLTIRSNIISGFNKSDFLVAKVELILILSIFSTLVIFLSGLYLGFVHSVSKSMIDVFGKMMFLLGYFIEIFSYLSFCLLLAIIFKRTGITFIVHFVYLIVEPILDYNLNEKITPFLPLNAINSIVRTPNTSLIKVKSPDFNFDFQEFVRLSDVGLCIGYAAIFIGVAYRILKKRDI
jgi:ABC-type transport system involved in multi-copper enzyme maturation permease subunit